MDAKDEDENEEDASTTYMNDNKTTSSAQWERKKDGNDDDDEKIAGISRPRRRVRVVVVVVVSIIDISFSDFLWGLDDVFLSFFAKTRRERASDGKTVLQMWAVCVVAIDSIIKRARVQSSKHDDDDATFQSRKNNARLVFLSPFRFFFFFILTNIQPRRTQRIKPNRRKSTLTFRLRSYCSFQTRNLGFVRSQRLVCRWIWTLTWTRRTPGSSSLLASL